jgi:acetoin utilization deacetylase AcuC-like enzyme
LNLPLPAGTDRADWLLAWDAEVLPALRAYQPDLILVSCGFDAHRADAMGGLNLEDDDYARLTQDLVALSQRDGCLGLVSLLEGGYDAASIGSAARAHLRALAGLPQG